MEVPLDEDSRSSDTSSPYLQLRSGNESEMLQFMEPNKVATDGTFADAEVSRILEEESAEISEKAAENILIHEISVHDDLSHVDVEEVEEVFVDDTCEQLDFGNLSGDGSDNDERQSQQSVSSKVVPEKGGKKRNWKKKFYGLERQRLSRNCKDPRGAVSAAGKATVSIETADIKPISEETESIEEEELTSNYSRLAALNVKEIICLQKRGIDLLTPAEWGTTDKIPFLEGLHLSVNLHDVGSQLKGVDSITVKYRGRGRPRKERWFGVDKRYAIIPGKAAPVIEECEQGRGRGKGRGKGRGRPRKVGSEKVTPPKSVVVRKITSLPTMQNVKISPEIVKFVDGKLVYVFPKVDGVSKVVDKTPVHHAPSSRMHKGLEHKMNYHNDLRKLLEAAGQLRSHAEEGGILTPEEKEEKERIDYEKSLQEFFKSLDKGTQEKKQTKYVTTLAPQTEPQRFTIPRSVGRLLNKAAAKESTNCTVCHLQFVSARHLEEHTSSNYLCTVCGVPFKYIVTRNLHASVHVAPPPARRFIKCTLCKDQGFSGENCQDLLTNHVFSVHHAGKKPIMIPCPICDDTFIETSLMRIHMDTHRPKFHDCVCKDRTCFACTQSPAERQVAKWKTCVTCQFRFYDLAQHLEVHAIKENLIYRCGICLISFSNEEMGKLHRKIHTSHRPPLVTGGRCSICGQETAAIIEHVTEMHQDAPAHIQCKYCDYRAKEQLLMYVHVRTHWPIKKCTCGKVKCKMCNKTKGETTHDEVLDLSWISRIANDSGEPNECVICRLCFMDKAELKTHMRAEHCSNSKYRCSSCKAGFCKKEVAEFHRNVHTGIQLTVRTVCSVCKEQQEGNEGLLSHVAEKHGSLAVRFRFTCSLCHINIPEENLYRIHLIAHIPKNVQNVMEGGLEAHSKAMIAAGNKLDFSLPNCGYEVEVYKALKPMPDSCSICYLSIDSQDYHVSEHQPSKAKFRCKVCKVTFTTEAASSTHAHIHCYKVPALMLTCSLCQVKKVYFSNVDRLVAHALTEHADQMNGPRSGKCGICQSVFPEENSLAAHRSLHTPKYCRCQTKDCKYCMFYICRHCGDSFNPLMKTHFLAHAEHCNEVASSAPPKRTSSPDFSQVIKIARVSPYQRSADQRSADRWSADQRSGDRWSADQRSGDRWSADQRSANQQSANQGAVMMSSAVNSTPSTPSQPQLITSDEEEFSAAKEDPGFGSMCVACGVQIKSGTITEHFRKYHNKPSPLLGCKTCRFKGLDTEDLVRHRVTHMPHDIFHCLFCAQHFGTWTDVLIHNYNVHFPTQHRCNMCMMYFSDLELLKKHNRMNPWDKPGSYPCRFCCRSFVNLNSCKEHEVVHGSECTCGRKTCNKCTKFRCSCSAGFKAHQFIQYMTHMRSCYQCSSCELGFNTKSELMGHEPSHYLRCEVCQAVRKTPGQLQMHMASHNCMCPADDARCLFCKKSWCTICGERFVRSELTNYYEHKTKCPESELLCICREKDCVICENGKCSYCNQMFKKHRFIGFSTHVRKCMGESPDPFASDKKSIKIKEEPMDVDSPGTRRRKQDSTVIPIDSDPEDKDKDRWNAIVGSSKSHTISAPSDEDNDDVICVSSKSRTPRANRSVISRSASPPASTVLDANDFAPMHQIINLCATPVISLPRSITPAEEDTREEVYEQMRKSALFSLLKSPQDKDSAEDEVSSEERIQESNDDGDANDETPQERSETEIERPVTATAFDDGINRNEQGIICVAPTEPREEYEAAPMQPQIINICPEEPMPEFDAMDNLIMADYMTQTSATNYEPNYEPVMHMEFVTNVPPPPQTDDT